MAKDTLIPCGASMCRKVSEIDDLDLHQALAENGSYPEVCKAIRAEIILRSRVAGNLNQRSIRSFIAEVVNRATVL